MKAKPTDRAPGAPTSPVPTRWLFRNVPVESLDARTTHRTRENGPAITVRVRLMLLYLESYCGSRCFTWIGNQELAEAYGCKERTLQEILKEMDEEDGLIRRVPEEGGHRIGIILLKRLDPGLPVCPPAEIPAMIVRLKAAIAESRSRRRTIPFDGQARKTAPDRRGKPRLTGAENRA